LGEAASEARAVGFEQAPERQLIEVTDYAPRSIADDDSFQHPGLPENVLWFSTTEPPPPRLALILDGTRLGVNAREAGFSVQLPESLRRSLAEQPGAHPIWLYDPVVNQRQPLGELTVLAAAKPVTDFCEIENWGPRETRAGQAFNEQPDGASAMWLKSRCFPPDTVVRVGGVAVKTTLRPADALITTHITDPGLFTTPGELRVELYDPASGRVQPVGTFTVQP
ncbi:MAG: hypothetical protein RQ729_12060, partial [Wenzhouxiangellaceae bacterium]|nr:hypothetical protein [Wenzhouxiangellaceae bacterium]